MFNRSSVFQEYFGNRGSPSIICSTIRRSSGVSTAWVSYSDSTIFTSYPCSKQRSISIDSATSRGHWEFDAPPGIPTLDQLPLELSNPYGDLFREHLEEPEGHRTRLFSFLFPTENRPFGGPDPNRRTDCGRVPFSIVRIEHLGHS